jgi:RNA polymerase sigma factor (sigma-70 family)
MEGFETLHADRERWLAALRERMLQLAKRRVGEDDAEDMVQSALRVIAERGLGQDDASVDGLPPVAWCFQVLRNTIGNHYKHQRVRAKHLEGTDDLDSLPAAAVDREAESHERLRILERTLEDIERRDEQCGALLRRSMDGMSPQEIADERRLPMNALYQRLYRCRKRLRELLRERGMLT